MVPSRMLPRSYWLFLFFNVNDEQAQLRAVLVVDGACGPVGVYHKLYGRTRLQDGVSGQFQS